MSNLDSPTIADMLSCSGSVHVVLHVSNRPDLFSSSLITSMRTRINAMKDKSNKYVLFQNDIINDPGQE